MLIKYGVDPNIRDHSGSVCMELYISFDISWKELCQPSLFQWLWVKINLLLAKSNWLEDKTYFMNQSGNDYDLCIAKF